MLNLKNPKLLYLLTLEVFMYFIRFYKKINFKHLNCEYYSNILSSYLALVTKMIFYNKLNIYSKDYSFSNVYFSQYVDICPKQVMINRITQISYLFHVLLIIIFYYIFMLEF